MKNDAADKENHLEMINIDFGLEVEEQVSWYMVYINSLKFIMSWVNIM